MNKNMQCILRGYLFYRINQKHYFFYSTVQRERKRLTENRVDVTVDGYHIFKSWRGLFFGFNPPEAVVAVIGDETMKIVKKCKKCGELLDTSFFKTKSNICRNCDKARVYEWFKKTIKRSA